MSAIEVRIPDIGDFHDIPVIEVLVKEGDTVAVDDSLVTLESDKATMDVPSPAAGIVLALRIGPGDKVSAGTVVLTLEAGAAPQHAAPVAGTLSAAPRPEAETPAPRGDKGLADAPGEGANPTPPAGQTI
jgi:pyruvate/2-oxoglutarate dehydrogenase complex dihydrolipoamide acyltransferase (E2) component